MFAMLTGHLPFNTEETCDKVAKLYGQIKKGLSETNLKLLRSLSSKAMTLLCKILTVEVSKRITMDQIKNILGKAHTWVDLCSQAPLWKGYR